MKQEIPVLTGPGSFFIALLIFALFCTSNKSQQLLFNWEFVGALVLISVPLSVFFIQIYHGYAILIGYKKWNLGTEFEQFHDHKHRIVCMMDYLSWKDDQETINEWTIIYRKAQGRNLFGSLFFSCVFFFIFYIITLSGYLIGYPTFWIDAYSSPNLLGIFFILCFVFGLAWFFYKVKQELTIVIGIFDRKLMNSFRFQMNSWINDEKELISDDPPK